AALDVVAVDAVERRAAPGALLQQGEEPLHHLPVAGPLVGLRRLVLRPGGGPRGGERGGNEQRRQAGARAPVHRRLPLRGDVDGRGPIPRKIAATNSLVNDPSGRRPAWPRFGGRVTCRVGHRPRGPVRRGQRPAAGGPLIEKLALPEVREL